MHPVVRVFVERAAGNRQMLLELARVVPPTYWSRSAPGQAWSAYEHLAHALTSDGAFMAVLEAPRVAEGVAEAREAAVVRARQLSLQELLEESDGSRLAVVNYLRELPAQRLDALLEFKAEGDWQGRWPAISVQKYLEVWSRHDAEHAAAIREAISAAPELGVVAQTRRLR